MEYLSTFCPERELAWDVGTGNGQAATLLASRFRQVVATDASAGQIKHAHQHPRVTYRVAPAESSGLEAGSVDLITVAQALHWFDLPPFYREVHRVLKPRGVFAAWCYGLMRIDADVDALIREFYTQRVGRYWPHERRHVESAYVDLPFPFENAVMENFAIVQQLTRGELLDYVGTWSAVQRFRSREGSDPVIELGEQLAAVWPRGKERRTVEWPIVVRVGGMKDPV